jgi:endonuclease YncB( thermonuclease family)
MRWKSFSLSPRVTRFDLWLGGAAFCLALALGGLLLWWPSLEPLISANSEFLVIASIALVVLLTNVGRARLFTRLWRTLGDRIGVGEPRNVIMPWVIDGDTLDDRALGVRYRLANIDAPETGKNARCFHERRIGERAKSAAISLVRGARNIEVRRTWRLDIHGRRVAYVYVDGADLGEALVRMGLARRWKGRRKRWCGPKGPLTQMAALRNEHHACAACAKWRF